MNKQEKLIKVSSPITLIKKEDLEILKDDENFLVSLIAKVRLKKLEKDLTGDYIEKTFNKFEHYRDAKNALYDRIYSEYLLKILIACIYILIVLMYNQGHT